MEQLSCEMIASRIEAMQNSMIDLGREIEFKNLTQINAFFSVLDGMDQESKFLHDQTIELDGDIWSTLMKEILNIQTTLRRTRGFTLNRQWELQSEVSTFTTLQQISYSQEAQNISLTKSITPEISLCEKTLANSNASLEFCANHASESNNKLEENLLSENDATSLSEKIVSDKIVQVQDNEFSDQLLLDSKTINLNEGIQPVGSFKKFISPPSWQLFQVQILQPSLDILLANSSVQQNRSNIFISFPLKYIRVTDHRDIFTIRPRDFFVRNHPTKRNHLECKIKFFSNHEYRKRKRTLKLAFIFISESEYVYCINNIYSFFLYFSV